MSTSTKLSKTEVEALISGLDGEDGQVSAAEEVASDKKIRDFTFGSDDL